MQLQQHEKELESLGVTVVVVTFEIETPARAYFDDMKLGWPLLLDPSREIYKAYGMERGNWWNIYGPATVWMYFKLMIRGRKPQPATGDVEQLGGDVLIDPHGIARLQHIGAGPADRPAVAQLLAMVRQLCR